MVKEKKWILYKHTSNFELVKAVALDVKNKCKSDISEIEKYRMQDRLAALDLYKTRNPKSRPLDSINHRINTLKYWMFGYEKNIGESKKFLFSPLGNLFIRNINNSESLKKIFLTMLFSIQFQHPNSSTDPEFQLYPFRLIINLLTDRRLGFKLYNFEVELIIVFIREIDVTSYENLIDQIIDIRTLETEKLAEIFRSDEHTYVNTVYEWEYYTQKLLRMAGIINYYKGEEICRLFHPRKTNSKSPPTSRKATRGYIEINEEIIAFAKLMLSQYSFYERPLLLNEPNRLQEDIITEIYSFYPDELLNEIGENEELQNKKILDLPKLIKEYSNNIDNVQSYLFEKVLVEGFNLFYNVQAKGIGGPGQTDIECLYIPRQKKFAVDAKSTTNKLLNINSGRLRSHREKIGAEYSIVVTSRYVPAVMEDIKYNDIVIIQASTFAEYLYNHLTNGVREIDYEDFDSIIVDHKGSDISNLISLKTLEKFAVDS